MLAADLIKRYGKKNMIKLDMKKVYDSIEWSFLESMLIELGFPHMLVRWIMCCVEIVTYSVLFNGRPINPLRQQGS